jgi:hypothetical protein
MKRLASLSLILLASGIASALDMAQLRELRTAVLEMCRGGTVSGSSSRFEVQVNAKGNLVILKGVGEAGADAKVQLSKEQWTGIQALANPEHYSECVTHTVDTLTRELNNQKT